MSSLAEQIKELQLKLQAIQEAEVAAFQPTGSDAVGSIASTDAPPAPAPVPQSAGEQIPTIEAPTFSQAYAQAKKQGLKKFKWCGVYAVKDKVRPQPVPPRPKPRPPEATQDFQVTNPMGDFDPTAFSGQAAAR